MPVTKHNSMGIACEECLIKNEIIYKEKPSTVF